MSEANLILSNLPLYVVLIPLVSCFLILLSDEKKGQAFKLAILSNLAALLILVFLIPSVSSGDRLGKEYTWLFEPFGLQFDVGRIGLFMAILSGFLWLIATIYSKAYLANRSKQKRYYAFLELTLTGCLGVYLTGNLFTLFIFFEILSIAPFVLVIYNETPESFRAGYLYLALSIFGGLSLLLGLILLYTECGTLLLAEIGNYLPHSTSTNWWIALLLIIGFGVKAGIVPLHIWLPQAHPVAPTPASALLSGVMIKAGAYGIFLTLSQVFFHQIELVESLGYIIAWMGIVTMLLGAFSALRQIDAKRLLAYSSVSQIGYIILAIGLATYLGEHGTMGFLGAFYHIFNHALFKVGFFLNIGIIYQLTHEKRLDHLGGLWHVKPISAIMFLLFAGGIIGVPGFNGYGSKTIIHHTITEAIHLNPRLDLVVMEYLFILTGAITFAYIMKMYTQIYLGQRPSDLQIHQIPYKTMQMITFPLGVLVLINGLIPQSLIQNLFQPMIVETGYDLQVGREFFAHFSFWNIKDLTGVLPYFIFGTIFYWLESRYRLFTRMVPHWFGIEQFVTAVTGVVNQGFQRAYYAVDKRIEKTCRIVKKGYKAVGERLVAFDRSPKSSKVGPISIASLDFSKLWLALVIVVFLLLSLLKVIELP